MVYMVDINTHYTDSIEYIIKFLRGNKTTVTKEFLKASNVTDIGFVPISSQEYINESNNLTQEQNENTMFPEVLSPLQHLFKSWNNKSSHLHSKSIFRLAKF